MKILIPFLGIGVLLFSCTTANSNKPVMIADVDPIPLGTVTLGFEKFFSSSLGQKEVSLVFDPRLDMVYLQFTYETVTYRQFWDKPNREKFILALVQYQKDFENRNLTTKKSKSRQAYGVVKGKTEWGQFSFSVNYRSYPRMELGYLFNEDHPYFTVLQREANDVAVGGDKAPRSLRITTYFTRAQALELASAFDQEYLLTCLEERGVPLVSDLVVDEY